MKTILCDGMKLKSVLFVNKETSSQDKVFSYLDFANKK